MAAGLSSGASARTETTSSGGTVKEEGGGGKQDDRSDLIDFEGKLRESYLPRKRRSTCGRRAGRETSERG